MKNVVMMGVRRGQVDGAEEDGAAEGGEGFGEEGGEEVQLGGDEGGGVTVAGPAGYVDAVEGLIQESPEVGEWW